MLQCMGVLVLEERPFTVVRPDGLKVWIYQFKIRPDASMPDATTATQQGWDATAQRFSDAVTAIWHGRAEIDRFNELVLRAGLTWQQVAVLRAYAKYLRQSAFPYSQAHIETVLNDNADTARSLVALFEAMFDPESAAKGLDAQAAAAAVTADIDALVSLDTDRVLRAFASMIQATLRTNYFVDGEDSARAQNVLSVKLNPQLIDELPLPRPKFEIFVYSPRVEGVHLRFGFVARGGLRWSDRREDFRTEILGLVKAQAVKNAVIVPVGAKGGFVVKQPPAPTGDAAADRDALPQRRCGLLPAVHRRSARHHRQRRPRQRPRHHPARRGAPRRRRRLPRGRRRQGHRHLLRHRQRRRQVLRLLARRRVRLRRLGGLRPQGHGHHRQGRLGGRQTALPGDGGGHPDRGLHRRRRRRHERRRVRQRDAALASHPADRGLRPPAHLRRSRPGRRQVLGGAAPAVRPAALELGGLRHQPDQRGRRGVQPPAEVDPDQPADARGAGHRRRRHRDDAARPDADDPAGAGGPAVQRRHRHLHQGRVGIRRRRRRPGQRHGAGQRKPGARQGRRRGRQPRCDLAGPGRVRPVRRSDQHRCDGQLRRRGLLRPRGQHQDPGRLAGHRGQGQRRGAHRAAGCR